MEQKSTSLSCKRVEVCVHKRWLFSTRRTGILIPVDHQEQSDTGIRHFINTFINLVIIILGITDFIRKLIDY